MPQSDEPDNVTSFNAERYKRMAASASSNDSINNLSCYSLGVCNHKLTAALFDIVNLQHLTANPCTGVLLTQDAHHLLLRLSAENDQTRIPAYISRIQGLALHQIFGLNNALRYIVLNDARIWTEGVGTDFDRKTENNRRLDMIDGAIYAEMICYRALPAVQEMLTDVSDKNPVEISSQLLLNSRLSPISIAPMQGQLKRLAQNKLASDRKRIKDTQVVSDLLSKAARLPYPLDANVKFG